MNAIRCMLGVILMALAVLSLSCQDNDEKPHIRVVTLEPEVIDNTTVKIGARFDPTPAKGDEYGFVWDALPGPDYGKGNVRFNLPLSTSELTAELTGLFQGQVYYVRAYLNNRTTIEYGEEKSFVFGGLKPEIKSLSQNTGHWGDTLRIVGENFVHIQKGQFVQIGDLISKITTASPESIECVVPMGLPPGAHAVKVTLGNLSSNTLPFTLAKPEIENISPSSATYLDLIVIEGTNFRKDISGNKVRFGTVSAEVVEASKTHLTIRVPVGLVESPSMISVQVDSQRVNAPTPFSLIPMSVSAVTPTSERIGNLITIQGSNFNPSGVLNEVLFENTRATVIEASANQLTVQVPSGIYSDRNVVVSLKIAGQTHQTPFTIKNAWIRKADIPAGIFGRCSGEGFTINNVGYAGLGLGTGNSPYADFYRFDEQANAWTRIADYGGGKRYWAASFVINNVAYVGTGSATETGEGKNDFYKYDPTLNVWSRIADFPGTPASRAVGFSANGKGYLCIQASQDNFWEYDPALDQWTKKANLDASLSADGKRAVGAFVLENRAFVVAALHSYGQLFEYDFANDAWITKNTFSGLSAQLPAVYATNSDAYYLVDYNMARYDLLNDTWNLVDFDPVPTRNDAFFFSIGEKLFLGGGRENSYRDFWECDTSKL